MAKRRDTKSAQLFPDEEDEGDTEAQIPDGPEYRTDPADGMLAEVLKPHSKDKHLLTIYRSTGFIG